MAKGTNRWAWGLIWVLAVVVPLGGGVLFASYQDRLPKEFRWVSLIPKRQWGFGLDNLAALAFDLKLWRDPGDAAARPPERYRLGFLSVRIQ